jgi:hypothetical protein
MRVLAFLPRFSRMTMFASAVLAAALAVSGEATAKNDATPLQTFQAYIINNDLQAAQFFLQNGIVKAEDVDASALFLKALFANNQNGRDARPLDFDNIEQVGALYDYLSGIGPVDLNGRTRCWRRDRWTSDRWCGLAAVMLAQGIRPATISFFLQRGLDLSARPGEVASPALALIANLGSRYSLEDLNWFAQNGLELGKEIFPLSQFTLLQEFYELDLEDAYKIPEARLDSQPFNFLDALSMTLTSRRFRNHERSANQDFLCRYIMFVAGQMPPTFDHFSFLMLNVGEFRGANIGKTDEARTQKSGRFYYEVFPQTCISMIGAMALSSARLDQMISHFAAEQDISTAQWLVNLKQGALQSNVQNN